MLVKFNIYYDLQRYQESTRYQDQQLQTDSRNKAEEGSPHFCISFEPQFRNQVPVYTTAITRVNYLYPLSKPIRRDTVTLKGRYNSSIAYDCPRLDSPSLQMPLAHQNRWYHYPEIISISSITYRLTRAHRFQ